MIEILSESKLVTTSSPPSGFSARLTGVLPTSSKRQQLVGLQINRRDLRRARAGHERLAAVGKDGDVFGC